ncbi:MAG: ABC transporter permease [Solirubrobacteraceae bacterium]
MSSLLRADFAVLLKNRRALLISIFLPILILFSTNSSKATHSFGGSLFIIGLAIALGLVSNSILGYALTVARDREQGVFQRLRVTPAPTWTIMTSRLAMQALANLLIAVIVVIVGTRIHHVSLSVGTYGLVLVVSILGGAVFLSIGQALVGLVKSADSINAAGRVLVLGLVLLSSLGQSGTLGNTWESIARWSPVGVVMTLFAAVLNLSTWDTHDSLALLACGGYIVVFAAIGIRWFQWDAR